MAARDRNKSAQKQQVAVALQGSVPWRNDAADPATAAAYLVKLSGLTQRVRGRR